MSHLWIFLRPVLALASEQVRAGGKRQSRAHDHLCSVADKLEVQLELIAQRHLKDTVMCVWVSAMSRFSILVAFILIR